MFFVGALHEAPVCAAEGSGEGFVGCGRAMPFAVHPAWAGVVTGFGPPGRRPLRWIAMPFTVHPALAVGGAGQAGADSASDTPRRMSGWWSQCPWGKSSAPTQGLPMPGAIHPGGGGGRCRVWRDTQVPPYGGYCHRLPFDRPGGYRPLIRPCGATFSPRRRLGVGGTFFAAGWLFVADYGTMSAQFHPHTFPQKERGV